jgi:NAD(P)-dependent dehydrogenase (short-subunit alcohol dehydrogenase family)
MPTFEITGPDGSKYQVDGPDEQGALAALQKHLGTAPSQPKASKAGNWGMMNEALSTVLGDYPIKMNAAAGGLIDSTINAATGGEFNYSDNYNRQVAEQRQAQADYNSENPVRSAVGTGAGMMLGIANMPVIGSRLKGAAAPRGARC